MTDAATTDVDGGATAQCPCPSGTTEGVDGGTRLCLAETGASCNRPLVVTCATELEIKLCAASAPFTFGGCEAGAPAAFVGLGPLDGGWHVDVRNGTALLARANAACNDTNSCESGDATLMGNFVPAGNPIAIGRIIADGCTTVRVSLAPRSK